MCEGIVTCVHHSVDRISNELKIALGLQQELILSHYLSTLVINELTRKLKDKSPWCVLFASDIISINQTRGGVIWKLYS